MQVASTLDFLADRDSRNLALVAQINEAKFQLGDAVRRLPNDLTRQLDSVASTGRVDLSALLGSQLNVSRILSKYQSERTGRGLFPEVDDAKEALRELYARTQAGPIIAGVIQPAVREIEQ